MTSKRDINAVHYTNSLWVAVGDGGTILTSTNGTTWKEKKSYTSENLQAVYYANSLWVAVGSKGMIVTSKKGISWKPINA